MSQWFALKADQPDALLFFRMGDFYELFFDDAHAAVAALDIQLTYRGKHAGQPIPMCGVPVHAAESYLSRLIRRGFRVAVAEQMDRPQRNSKTPVRRAITRLITPGTLIEDTLLDAARPNLLLALAAFPAGSEQWGAAWMDISTGLFETAALAHADLPALIGRIDPAEILAPDAAPNALAVGEWSDRRAPAQPVHPPAAARRRVADGFAVADLDAFGEFTDAEAVAAALALDYVRMTQAGQLPRLSHPVPVGAAGLMGMDAATRASLEITRARDGSGKHTLLGAVDRTLSAAGGRMLAARLASPLLDPAEIAQRQAGWGWLLAQPGQAARLRAVLKGVPDMARALGRLSLGRCVPRDLAAVRDGLCAAHDAAALLDGAPPFADLAPCLRVAPALRGELARALAGGSAARGDGGSGGGAVMPGFDGELDAHCSLRDDSRRVIAGLQLDFAQHYGVASLKIRHHAQLGYVIEAPLAAVEGLRARPELQLRQGMANAARFTHPELSALDQRITEAADLAAARERAVLDHLAAQVLAEAAAVAGCAEALAALDVAQSAARLAEGGLWCRPDVDASEAFRITGGRHPVVEAALSGQAAFVPNDCDLSPDRRVLLLTGPNMAGKSTYLRQNALIAILAQAGLPVPARSAHLGVVDRLFSRVGASDDLARGRSTFMVEMTEAAAILHGAGPRSLVVVDEIGRGTATLDGLALAWAVLEALHFGNRCRTVFATHFHELGQLGGELPRLRPCTMRVKDWRGDVVFLHEVADGAAGRSWGVHVAKLAGVPAPVVRRAGQLLAALERNGPLTGPAALPLFATMAGPDTAQDHDKPDRRPDERPDQWLDEWPDHPAAKIRAALAEVEPDQLTPREALETLYYLKMLATGQTAGGS